MAESWESEGHVCVWEGVSVGKRKVVGVGGIGGICAIGSGIAEDSECGGCNGEQEQSGCSFIYITHSRRLVHRTSC